MAKVAEELRGDYGRITPARMVELFQMLPPSGVTQSSADIIRELRGPLPDDDPEYQRFLARGGERESSPQEKEAYEAVRRDLHAIPEGQQLTNEELFALIRRLPRIVTSSSADVIRELRGPLPEDDPDFPRDDRR